VAAAGLALLATLAAGGAQAQTLPTGGRVAAGTGSLSQSGSTLTVNQSSSRLAVDWQTFSVGQGATVNFVQPSSTAVALNRVLGADVSVIQGAVKANGQLFLLNPNGVLFTPTAQVNAGAIVASTLQMGTEDFMAGRYRLSGSSLAPVVNQGSLAATGGAQGGAVALIAAQVVNTGSITADGGAVLLAAARDVTLDLGGPAQLQVNAGVLDALVDNGGAIRADGGRVYLTARAVDALASATVNNTGVVRAQTLASGEKGEIRLIADMQSGTARIGGTLDASAPRGGDGGFIETSGAAVQNLPGLQVSAAAPAGRGGEWLVDPYDYTIDLAAATTISNSLNGGTSVTVTTASANAGYGSTGTGLGDITVASPIAKTAGGDAALVLRADHSVLVNQPITSTAGKLDITLSSANAGGNVGGVSVKANLGSNGGDILIGGALTGGSQLNGIGYAQNLDEGATLNPAVLIGTGTAIRAGGGNIVINGQSHIPQSGNNKVDAVYIADSTTISSGGGNVLITGDATAANDTGTFGVKFAPISNTLTKIETSPTSGYIQVTGINPNFPTSAINLVNNGSLDQLIFLAPSVAQIVIDINGNILGNAFQYQPPNSGCNSAYPNCGYFSTQLPGGNNSNLYASYGALVNAQNAIYVLAGGSRTYDGLTAIDRSTLDPWTSATGYTTTDLKVKIGGGASSLPSGLSLDAFAGAGGLVSFSTSSKNAGTYNIGGSPATYGPINAAVNGVYPAPAANSYAIGYYGKYVINKKSVSNLSVDSKYYDGTTTATLRSSDFIAGDVVNALGGFSSPNATSTYLAGTVDANHLSANAQAVTVTGFTGADAGNYTLASTPSGLSADIWKAALTLTASNASKTYGDLASFAGTAFTPTGLKHGETVGSVSESSTGAAVGANVGSYDIVPSAATGGTFDPGNYVITYAPGTLTVNGRSITVTADNKTKVYGDNNPTLSFQVTSGSLVNGDTLSGGVATSATQYSDVGHYDIARGTVGNANYIISFTNGTLTVNGRPISVTADGKTKVYGDSNPTLSYQVTAGSLVNGDTLSGGVATSATQYSDVGRYDITRGTLGNANYVISFTNGTLAVNGRPISVTADDKTKVYGDSNPALSFQVTAGSLVNGDTLSGSLATIATPYSNVGSYGITRGNLDNGNYVISFVDGALRIAPRPLTVAADDQSKLQGAPDPALTYRLVQGNLVGQDGLGALTRAPGEAPGSYRINATALSNPNYQITAIDGQLAIVAVDSQPAPAPAPLPPLPQLVAPIVVPNFADNAAQALGADTASTGMGSLNYITLGAATQALPGSTAGAASSAAPAGFASAAAPAAAPEAGASPAPARSGDTAREERAAAAQASSPAAGALNFVEANADGSRKGGSELNVNNVTVPSANGPLDVFVVDTGVNRSGVQVMRALGN